MIDTDVLLTFAQLAAGLIGVSGIIAAFVARGGLHPVDRLRFVYLVLNGMLVVLFAMVPIWVAYFVDNPEVVWRVASLCALICVVTIVAPVIVVGQRNAEIWRTSLGAPVLDVVPPTLAAFGLILYALNALAWPLPANPVFYEINLFSGLAQLVAYFAHLTLHRPS